MHLHSTTSPCTVLGRGGRVVAVVVAAFATHAHPAETWFDAFLQRREEAREAIDAGIASVPLPDLGTEPFTLAAWIRTTRDGSIAAKTVREGIWVRDGKALFVRGGKVCFDVGWVGVVTGKTTVTDGEWHHIALSGSQPQKIYVDGALDAAGRLIEKPDPKGSVLKLGHTSVNFPSTDCGFRGEIDDVRLYVRVLAAGEIETLHRSEAAGRPVGLAAHWPLDGDVSDPCGGNTGMPVGELRFADGRSGEALSMDGTNHVLVPCPPNPYALSAIRERLRAEFADPVSGREMAWEREDGIWGPDWATASLMHAAERYTAVGRRLLGGDAAHGALPSGVDPIDVLKQARRQYLRARQCQHLLAESGLRSLAAFVRNVFHDTTEAGEIPARAEALKLRAADCADPEAADATRQSWRSDVAALRRDLVRLVGHTFGVDTVAFVKRNTYSANHYYTEYINSRWMPGGTICTLSLADSRVRELAPALSSGVVGRFDLSFDGRRIVFGWKRSADEGYRIYELDPGGGDLRQLTFPPDNENELVEAYRVTKQYHHGTDDMHPCYLPDGGIAFISTRCRYGILCDAPDNLTTTVLYRMNADGSGLRRLSNSSVSEASPAVLPDGRIMYTRWEYLDKGAVSVKCLWAMRPDGTGSAEIYANDVALPPTFIYGRPLPGSANRYVVLGTPHCPQNGVGTVIRLDMTKPIRSREPMTYMTPDVDIQREPGFAFRTGEGAWRHDPQGRGPLFKDPYPLSDRVFLVAHKPAGPVWSDPRAYGLYLLDDAGNTVLICSDPVISCWQPYPLRPRRRPRELRAAIDPELASKDLAVCVVVDVYRGLEGVARGTVKHIRMLEQVPRPWAARRRWSHDVYDQQHACISKDTHLGLKAQHGVVPVEEDGSAHFVVPAGRNITLQALDARFMAVQTERTYVNYMPGERRSCVGCHATPEVVASAPAAAVVSALKRPPSIPGPQPGEAFGRRPLHYPADVQPVWDSHCLECHAGAEPKAGLDLCGTPTERFSVSYESLVPERRKGHRDRGLLGPVIGENHPKTGNVHYLPPRSLGSHASVLVAMLSKGRIELRDPAQAQRARKLAEAHAKVALTREELVRVTNWVDTNCQYYGSYWGRRALAHRDHPNFRPIPTFDSAVSMTSPVPEEER